MSVVVYNGGDSLKIAPEHIQHYQDIGWSLVSPAHSQITDGSQEQSEPEAPPTIDIVQEYTNAEIRDMARLAGVDNWETAKINTLKKTVGLADEPV